jgi:hypothetical protein
MRRYNGFSEAFRTSNCSTARAKWWAPTRKGNHKLLLEAVREAKNQIEENNGGDIGMRKPLEMMSRGEKLNYTFTGDPSDDSWRRNPRFTRCVEVEVVEG